MTTEEIQDSILLADLYTLEITDLLLAEQKKGCNGCKHEGPVNQITNLVLSLENRISRNDLGSDTAKIYTCLLTAIENFSGSSVVDPNALVDGITIIVDGGSGSNLPPWIDVNWSEMTNDVDGYRDTYYNPLWIGLNPAITREGTIMYRVDVDYTNDGNGTIVFNDGKGFYDGSFFRAENYQPYGTVSPTIQVLVTWVTIPNPPTNGIVDDNNNTFTFTGGTI